jgi:ATP-dependent RNA helicase RhlE
MLSLWSNIFECQLLFVGIAVILTMKFTDFNFGHDLLDALDAMGYENPTPIQQQAIPLIQADRDIIACAQTGTGKTAAFLLPVLDKIADMPSNGSVLGLVIAPTRELALQIDQQAEGLGYYVNTSSIAVYGGGKGDAFEQQRQALENGADLVVATPGRLLAHLNLGYVSLDEVRFLILDEADRMLDMGFFDDILKIIKFLPKERQTLLFSATMPPKIKQLAQTILKDPAYISINLSKPAEGVLQGAYILHDYQKIPLLHSLLKGKEETYPSVIIFSSQKTMVTQIMRDLYKKGFSVAEMSSNLEQAQREQVLRDFRSRKTQILVATDVMSRGIDIKEISLVINYDVPGDAEDYVHRVGRTARADSTGVALTFVSENDMGRFGSIESLIAMQVQKLPLPTGFEAAPVYDPKAKYSKPGFGKPSRGGSSPARGGAHKGGNSGSKPSGKPRFDKPKK